MKDRPHKCRVVFDSVKKIADDRKSADMLSFRSEMQEVCVRLSAVNHLSHKLQ
jgi:hypothetical protein